MINHDKLWGLRNNPKSSKITSIISKIIDSV